jgi:hypothetical protein
VGFDVAFDKSPERIQAIVDSAPEAKASIPTSGITFQLSRGAADAFLENLKHCGQSLMFLLKLITASEKPR